MMIRKVSSTLLFCCLLGIWSGAVAAPLQIFVSIPPQKWLSDQLGGACVSTRVLVHKGQEPHTFEPTPRQLAALFHARLYFTLELPFERKISRKIKQSATGLQIVDVTTAIRKIPMVGRDTGAHQTGAAVQNKKNLEEIKEPYLKGLKFHFVNTIMDVIDIALLKTKVDNPIKIE